MHRTLWIALALALPGAAAAAPPRLTIYSQDLGFVRETRTLEAGAGRDTVRIDRIPRGIDVASVRLAPQDLDRGGRGRRREGGGRRPRDQGRKKNAIASSR